MDSVSPTRGSTPGTAWTRRPSAARWRGTTRSRVPIFSIHGDQDAIVPLEENVGELTRRYQALGGPAELVVLPGLGHEEVPPFFTSERLLAFFLTQGS
jgi:pimeloyl-ACP methyl ester carboxylesterase